MFPGERIDGLLLLQAVHDVGHSLEEEDLILGRVEGIVGSVEPELISADVVLDGDFKENGELAACGSFECVGDCQLFILKCIVVAHDVHQLVLLLFGVFLLLLRAQTASFVQLLFS